MTEATSIVSHHSPVDENYDLDDMEIEPAEDDEELHDPLEITDPFDPRLVDITGEAQNVRYLLDLLEDGHVDLNTEFQRSRDLWSVVQMSRLIESLLIRFPIPPFYFAADETLPPDKAHPLQIVDGLQRLSSLDRFVIDGTLRLTGLSFFRDLEKKRFVDLDRPFQKAIERAMVTVYTIRPGTPKEVKYHLFERLNTVPAVLNAQEMRHALNQGIPAKYLVELADLPSFKKLIRLSSPRMRDRELALRYLAFRMTPPIQYRPGLKAFLDEHMERIGWLSEDQRELWKSDFDRSLCAAWELFGPHAFSKHTEGQPQLNTALFEAWTVNLALLDEANGDTHRLQ